MQNGRSYPTIFLLLIKFEYELLFYFSYLDLFPLLTNTNSLYPGSHIDHGTSRRKLMDYAKWSFEASGAYMAYSSIAEKRMSVRRNFNANAFFNY